MWLCIYWSFSIQLTRSYCSTFSTVKLFTPCFPLSLCHSSCIQTLHLNVLYTNWCVFLFYCLFHICCYLLHILVALQQIDYLRLVHNISIVVRYKLLYRNLEWSFFCVLLSNIIMWGGYCRPYLVCHLFINVNCSYNTPWFDLYNNSLCLTVMVVSW